MFGRRSFETEAANVMRVIANLKEVRKIDSDSDFLKAYYAALRQHLEHRLLFGTRKRDKYDRS